jgi:hypothetical protein
MSDGGSGSPLVQLPSGDWVASAIVQTVKALPANGADLPRVVVGTSEGSFFVHEVASMATAVLGRDEFARRVLAAAGQRSAT